jgi:hypothetical protein
MPDLSPATRARHIAELGLMESALVAAGHETKLFEPDDPNELPQLFVNLGQDDLLRQRVLHLRIIPADDGGQGATRYLEMFVPLPVPVPAERIDEVRQALTIVNEYLAIGLFGLRRNGSLYYRYVLATPFEDMVDSDMLAEVVSLILFHQDHFTDYLEGVCEDEISLLVLDRVIEEST